MAENQNVGQSLIIPIYLDTNALLDILASIEDGFTSVEKITTLRDATDTTDNSIRSIRAEINTPILKINLDPAKKRTETGHEQEQREAERYHTSGSLFNRLRAFLIQEQLLKHVDDEETWKNLRPSDFVELSGTFQPHPFVDWFKSVDKLFPLLMASFKLNIANLEEAATKLKPQKNKPDVASALKQITEQIDAYKAQITQFANLRDSLDIFRADIDNEDIRTFVVNIGSKTAVTSVFIEYLRDKSATELSHKHFCLLGKVVEKFDEGDQAINLLVGTGLGGLEDGFLNQLTDSLDSTSGTVLKLPKIITKILPPALQVVPIAIYI